MQLLARSLGVEQSRLGGRLSEAQFLLGGDVLGGGLGRSRGSHSNRLVVVIICPVYAITHLKLRRGEDCVFSFGGTADLEASVLVLLSVVVFLVLEVLILLLILAIKVDAV